VIEEGSRHRTSNSRATPASPIAFVPGARGFSGQSIAIADLDGSRRQTLVEATDAIWWPAISPDGTKIAYVDGTTAWDSSGSVYLVEVSTGASTKVADGRTAEWLDDDTLIVNTESTPPNCSP
jgi:Tol biopolymer transport system component